MTVVSSPATLPTSWPALVSAPRPQPAVAPTSGSSGGVDVNWTDVADGAGALGLGPVPALRGLFGSTQIQPITSGGPDFDRAYDYMASKFSKDDIDPKGTVRSQLGDPNYCFDALTDKGKVTGGLIYNGLPIEDRNGRPAGDFTFMNNVAANTPEGADHLLQYAGQHDRSSLGMVWETAPNEAPIARRNGFHELDFPYIQPSVGAGDQEDRLPLMVRPNNPDDRTVWATDAQGRPGIRRDALRDLVTSLYMNDYVKVNHVPVARINQLLEQEFGTPGHPRLPDVIPFK